MVSATVATNLIRIDLFVFKWINLFIRFSQQDINNKENWKIDPQKCSKLYDKLLEIEKKILSIDNKTTEGKYPFHLFVLLIKILSFE